MEQELTDFQNVITHLLLSGHDSKELALLFEVSESTILRWKSGVAVPHPRIQKLVAKLKEVD